MQRAVETSVVVPILTEEGSSTELPVHAIFDRIQRQVRQTRLDRPELADYHLNDVSLKIRNGALIAVLAFRR